jgi:mannose/fructose-specific phosphotransferase system component IIA
MPFLGKLPGVAPLELLDGSVTSQKMADLAIAAVDIADDAVTYSKIQNVSATDRLLGRDTAGAGIIEEITPSAIRTMINVEDGATADQTDAEIRAAVDAAADSNVFRDADHIKLDGITASANNYTHPTNHAISVVAGLQAALDAKVDDSRVLTDVPSGAVFTDTVYTHPTNHAISVVAGLQAALDAKVDDSRVLTDVPSGAVFTDTVYTHPTNHAISVVTGLQAALDAKADDTDISNIDNTSDLSKPVSTATQTALNAKVDDAQVLTDVPAGAVFTDTNTVYTHPNHSGEITSTADGATVIASNVVDEDNLKISNAGTNGQYLQKQSGNAGGMTWETVASAASVYSAWAVKTANYTAVAGDQLICNNAATAFTVALPASPSAGNTVVLSNAGAALVTVGRNGSNINSAASDGSLPNGHSTQLVYVGATIGWKEL